jgi:hypothetical protein
LGSRAREAHDRLAAPEASRKYALVQRLGQDPHPRDDEQRRYVRRRDTEDGMVKIEAVLHPEEAELVWAMLDHAATQLARAPGSLVGADSAGSREAAQACQVEASRRLAGSTIDGIDDSAELQAAHAPGEMVALMLSDAYAGGSGDSAELRVSAHVPNDKGSPALDDRGSPMLQDTYAGGSGDSAELQVLAHGADEMADDLGASALDNMGASALGDRGGRCSRMPTLVGAAMPRGGLEDRWTTGRSSGTCGWPTSSDDLSGLRGLGNRWIARVWARCEAGMRAARVRFR